MVVRTREDKRTLPGTMYRTSFPNTPIYSNPVVRWNRIEDHGSDRNLSLSISKRNMTSGSPLNGSALDGVRSYEDFLPSNFDVTSGNWAHPSFPNIPSNGALAASLLAETNPSQAVVDLPLFIYELRELPSLMRTQGTTILKQASEFNLQMQFGWQPLISDLKKLLGWTDMIDKRFRELKALRDGGIRRKRILQEDSLSGVANQLVHSNGATLRVNNSWISNRKVWGYVEWIPGVPLPQKDSELRDLAYRAVTGNNIDWYTLWSALPWSWLADWCVNVSDVLAANRNITGAVPRNCLIMKHYKTRSFVTPASGPWPPGAGPWQFDIETKLRDPASPSLSASFPILTGRQLSILGSLYIFNSGSPGKRTYLRTG